MKSHSQVRRNQHHQRSRTCQASTIFQALEDKSNHKRIMTTISEALTTSMIKIQRSKMITVSFQMLKGTLMILKMKKKKVSKLKLKGQIKTNRHLCQVERRRTLANSIRIFTTWTKTKIKMSLLRKIFQQTATKRCLATVKT